MSRTRPKFAAALLLALLFGLACPKAPPDEDAAVPGATRLELGVWHKDALSCTGGSFSCSPSVVDCADWFVFDVPGKGTIQVDIAKTADGLPVPAFELVLGDERGRELQRVVNEGGLMRLRIGETVEPGRLSLAVLTPEGQGGVMQYELRVSFTKKRVVVHQPRFDAVRAEILEVEQLSGGGEAVLIDKGRGAGFRSGQAGRLIEDGKVIGRIEIIEVYADGSRAKVVGRLSGPVTPSTIAEVDVPR